MYLKIKRDVYNIAKRIKKIDKNYYIVYNTSTLKFEIHCKNQIGSPYCLTLPYDELDERALKYVRSTQIANMDEILEKLEYDNQLVESAEKSRAFSYVADAIEQSFK